MRISSVSISWSGMNQLGQHDVVYSANVISSPINELFFRKPKSTSSQLPELVPQTVRYLHPVSHLC